MMLVNFIQQKPRNSIHKTFVDRHDFVLKLLNIKPLIRRQDKRLAIDVGRK